MEKVGIEIELMGAEEAHRLLQNLDKDIDRLNKRRSFRSLSGLNKSKAELEGYIKELERLQKLRQTKLDSGLSTKSTDKAIASTTAKIRQMSQAYDEATRKTKTFMQTAKSITSHVAHIGSAMQSLGNAMTRLTSPFSRLTTGLLYGAGYKALNLFTEGLSNSFERADTMKNYDRTLRALGLDVEKTFSIAGKEAKTAKENLDDAVQGLPTSLDEIMAAQKVYAGATGEMVESTKTAIAANNTVLASGMGDREARFMQRYLVALGSGAELTTMQWQSMARIAPLAMRAVSKELGYADKDYKQFTKDVQSGTVSGQEFLKAFQKVGTSGVVAAAARAQTESWSGLFSNIRIAVTRLGANVLETLNQTFKDETGRTLLQQLLGWDAEGNDLGDGIKGWINGISESIQNWIRSNPDKILGFFNSLKEFDWKGLMKGFAEGMMWFAKAMSAFAQWSSNKDLEKFGRWLPRINLLGKGLTILGGFLKGTRHIWGWLGAGFIKLAGGKLGKIGIFGKIASFLGKKKDVETAGEVGKAMTKASPFLIKGFKNMALLGAIVGGATFTGWAVTKGVKSSIKNFKDTIDLLKEINWDDAKKVLAGIAGYLGGSAIIGGLVGKFGVSAGLYTMAGEAIVGVISAIALAFGAADMRLIKDSFKSFADSMKYLQDGMDVLQTLPNLTETGGILESIGNAIDAFNQVTETIQGKRIEKGERSGGLKDIGKKNVKSLKNIADSVQYIKDAVNGLNELATIGINTGISSKLQYLSGVFKEVTEFINGKRYGADKQQGVPRVNGNKVSSLKNISEAIGQMKTIVDNLNTFASTGINASGNIKSKIDYIADAVDYVYEAFPKFARGKSGASALNTNASNFAGALIGIRRMVYHINQLAGSTVNVEGFKATIAQIKNALDELKSYQEDFTLDITVKLATGFQSSVNNVVKSINNAKKRISTAAGKGLNLVIPVRVRFTLSTNFGGILGLISGLRNRLKSAGSGGGSSRRSGAQEAMGGYIYRARGGNVPFKRRGTDTVPAMLTPGEYVHNKRAVSTFGIDFMRKVNNLDVKGAMNELMHRAGGMANVNRGVSITNNNYNNQKVTINNSNNAGAGFTFKSASRFVGAF